MSIISDIFKDDAYWVWVNCVRKSKYYEGLGYHVPRRKDKQGKQSIASGTEILIKVNDLSDGSNVNIIKICDICGEKSYSQPYYAVLNCRNKGDGLDRCNKCGWDKGAYIRKDSVPYNKSLAYKHPDIALTWNFERNGDIRPDTISAYTGDQYWWKCFDCNSDYEMSPHARAGKNHKCPFCSRRRVNETNCMWTETPELAKLLWNPHEGYLYSFSSNRKADFKCPSCGSKLKNKSINNVSKKGLFCHFCSDGVSFPEKFFINILTQIGERFDYQASFYWSIEIDNQNDTLNGSKRYDFYLPNKNCIIEVHGLQHYSEGFSKISRRSSETEKENDKIKERLAKKNGIEKYIVIDCSKSEIEFIKDSIIKSELSNLFDISLINWTKCGEFACNSLVKIASDLFREGDVTAIEISKEMKMCSTSIIKYLKMGSRLGWCNYDPKEESRKRLERITNENHNIPVVMVSLHGEFIQEFKSIKDAASQNLISPSSISSVLNGKQKQTAGYQWVRKSEYEKQKGRL